jgi:hypothetical protein
MSDRNISCAYMQFTVIYTSFAVMGYTALHEVTWRYMVIDHLVQKNDHLFIQKQNILPYS